LILINKHKTDILVLKVFLREMFNLWAGNGNCVEDVRKRYKDTNCEGIKRYVYQEILIKNPDPE